MKSESEDGSESKKDGKEQGRSSFIPRWRQRQLDAEAQARANDGSAAASADRSTGSVAGPAKKRFQARWRQHTAEVPSDPSAVPNPSESSKADEAPASGRKFQPRWRRPDAESVEPSARSSGRLHPNLQSGETARPEARGFQPRWRQRAQEVAAIEEQQHRQQQLEVQGKGAQESTPASASFQPRWRRTAASPQEVAARQAAEELPIQSGQEVRSPFQARWRRLAAEPTVAAPVEVNDPPEMVEPPPTPAEPVEPQAVALAAPGVEAVEETAAEAVAPVVAVEAAAPRYFLALVSDAEQVAENTVEPETESADPKPTEVAPLEGTSEQVETLLLGAEAVEGVEFLELSVEESPEQLLEALERKVRPPAGASLPGPDREAGPALARQSEVPAPAVEAPAPSEESRPFKKGLPPLPPLPPVQAPKPLPEHLKAALVDRTVPVDPSPAVRVQAPSPPPPPAPFRPATVVAPAQPLAARRSPPASAPAAERGRKWKIPTREARIQGEEVANFTRQLSVMIGSGLPLLQALHFFAEAVPGALGRVVGGVADKVSSGFRLSVAMSHHPTVFSEVYVGLIELGETSSHIEDALERLADLLEKQVRLSKRLSAALIYPAFLVAVSLSAVALFLTYVLPTMIPLFAGFGMELPWPTRLLLASRQMVVPGFLSTLLAGLAYYFLHPRWVIARRRRAPWARRFDRMLMRLPLLGKFLVQLATARVLFALATMLDSGLPLLNALQRCELVAGNLEIAGRLEAAAASVREGVTVVEAFQSHEVMPSACLHLLAAGEESAKMVEMVQYSARFYEEEVDQAINRFMSLVEPVIMMVMGFVVGFIVLSAVLPTVQMIQQLG